MIRFDTKKVMIAKPTVLLHDFMGFYHLRKDEDNVNVEVTLEPSVLKIKASCMYEGKTDTETHGYIFLMRTGKEKRIAYSINIKTDSSVKRVTLAQERRYPVNPVKNYEVKTSDTDHCFEAWLSIPLEEIGLPEGIQKGEYIELNVIKYRAGIQPVMTSSFPVRTSFFNDVATDQCNNCVICEHFVPDADIYKEGRFHRIYMDHIECDPYIATEEDFLSDISVVFEYDTYTRKKLVIKDLKELSSDSLKLYWKAPDEKIIPLNKIEYVKNEDSSLTVGFSHPEPASRGTYELHLVTDQNKVMILSFDKKDMITGGKLAMKKPDQAYEKTRITERQVSDEAKKLAELIPDRVGIYWVGNPDNPYLWPYRIYDWNPEKPDEIILKKDGSIWPDDKVIEDKKQVVTNDLGETVEYPYYEDEEKKKYHLSLHAEFYQRAHVLSMLPKLAEKDPLGASYVLLKLCENYKKYVPVHDTFWRCFPVEKRKGPPHPYYGGIWSAWFYTDLVNLTPAAEALRIVKKTDALEVLSDSLGFDGYDTLVNELFRSSVEYILSYKSYNGNMDYCVWLGLVSIGIAIEEPEYIHDAYERMMDYIAKTSLFDGFFMETTLSYHYQSVRGILRVANLMKGYSDPPGYISVLSGKRFDDLDPLSSYSMIEESLSIPWKLSYPDGRLLPLQDTWANDLRTGECSNFEKSYLAPAAGVAKLADGSGLAQSQLFLLFTAKYGHDHYDPLGITLYAYGCEMLPDIGYNYTRYRRWTAATLSHNTVTVNEEDADFRGNAIHGGNLEVFTAEDDTVRIVKVNQNKAYNSTKEYSRELWRIATGRDCDDAGYVLDLFRVKGGKKHEYSLNYDANHDAKMFVEGVSSMTDAPLLPADVNVTMPEKAWDKGDAQGHYFGYIYPKNTKKANLSDQSYKVVATSFDDEGKTLAGLNIHGIIQDEKDELLLCEIPSLRATRLYGLPMDTNDEAEQYFLPKIILRREDDELDSLFIHVFEPVDQKHPAQISDVKVLKRTKNNEISDDVVLVVSYGDTKDYILRLSGKEPFAMDDLYMEGKRGFIREVNGRIVKMVLHGGTVLKKGDVLVTGYGKAEGTLRSVMRKATGSPYNAFVTSDYVPEDIKGRTVIVTMPDGHPFGYTVEDVKREGDDTHIIISNPDPGFETDEDGNPFMVFYPFRALKGSATFIVEDLKVENVGGSEE